MRGTAFAPSAALPIKTETLVHGRTCDQCGGDWWSSFDSAGWSTCKDGCGMAGLYLNSVGGCKSLYCLEEAKCCRIADEHTCNKVDILLSFDTRGWASCPSNQYMCHIRRCMKNNRTLSSPRLGPTVAAPKGFG